MIYNMIILADMHWGKIDLNRYREELDSCLFEKIRKLKENDERIDYIIIAGDLFDTKEYLSSDVTRYVINFLNDLFLAIDPYDGTEIILIEGTRSHDNLQLDIIEQIFSMTDYTSRIKVVRQVEEYECGRGENRLHMLFIPEEYVLDQDAYYQDYINDTKQYDIIIGHGMIDKIWYAKKSKDNQTELTKSLSAPVFPVKKLCEISNYTYFGHVHTHKKYNKFMYVGPPSMWEFGNDQERGFMYIEYDTNTGVAKEEFVVNHLAQVFTTRIINIKEEISLPELNDEIDKVMYQEVSERNADHVQLIVNLNSKIPSYNVIREFVISKVGNIKMAKLTLSIDLDSEVIDTMKSDMEEIRETKKYAFDKNMEVPDRVQQYLRDKKNKELPIEKIKEYLSEEL